MNGKSSFSTKPEFSKLLDRERPHLERLIARRAGALLRFDTIDDLLQEVFLEAMRSLPVFVYQGDLAFRAWMIKLLIGVLNARRDHWQSLRRNAGKLLRIDGRFSGSRSSIRGTDPAAPGPAASTVARRREMLTIAIRAMSELGTRDRQLINSFVNDESIDKIAERLGLQYDAAKKARLRAVEKIRKLVIKKSGEGGGAEVSRGI
ncbi:MAG: RNA polymerase sigma factor [Planctomycetota bacterium]